MLKKILFISLVFFIGLFFVSISRINSNVLPVSLEISDISHLKTSKVYLLNKDNLLVGVSVFIEESNLEKRVKDIIKYLEISNTNNDLCGYLPKNIKVLSVDKNDDILKVDLSNEVISGSGDLDLIRTGLVYSFLEIDNINRVSISIEGQYIKGFTKELNKDIGINREYLLNSMRDINKVVIYYLDDTSTYYIPVTKYLNDKEEKVKIIISELRNNYNKDLISLIDETVELLDYRIDEGVLFLNFNSSILNDNSDVQDKIYKMISYSVFDNYDVNMVMFEINGKSIKQIKRNCKEN